METPPTGILPQESVEQGTWGGDHIQMTVSGDGATIRFDCAHGTIQGAIPLDAQGSFSVKGLYYQEHGGPVGVNEQPVPVEVLYSGQVTGEQMVLGVIDAGTQEKIGAYTLAYGSAGFVVECL